MTAQLCSGQGLSEKASQSAKYPNNYTFDDVLLCSGLRAYIRTGGGVGLNGVTLNKMSVLDNYNKAVRNEILAENESFFLEIKKVSDSVFSDYKVRRTAARKLSGYNEIKGIVEADGKIFENIDDMLERGLNAIKELRDPAKTPLRFNVDLAPEAFANTPGGDATGPRYVLNLRTSVSNLLAKWKTAASYLDGRHGSRLEEDAPQLTCKKTVFSCRSPRGSWRAALGKNVAAPVLRRPPVLCPWPLSRCSVPSAAGLSAKSAALRNLFGRLESVEY